MKTDLPLLHEIKLLAPFVLTLARSFRYISQATYKETRKVTDGDGKKFTCKYNIFYNSKTVVKSKSSVSCTPNTKGKAISEIFVIEPLGKSVTLKHAIKKGKDTISAVSVEDCKSLVKSLYDC